MATAAQEFSNAMQCFSDGQGEAGVAALERCVALDSNHAESWARIAGYRQQHSQLELAIIAYQKALALMPGFAGLACNYGGLLLQLGRFTEAEQSFRQAITHMPDLSAAHNGLGIALKNHGRLEEALDAFRRALTLKPGTSDFWFNAGNTLQALKRWPEAIDAYRHCNPPTADVYNNRGLAHYGAGEFPEAAWAHGTAVKMQPNHADAHNNLGSDFLAQSRFKEAIAAFERAIVLRPDFRKAICNLGNAYLAQNRLDEAIQAYRRASTDTQFPEALYNEALALLLKGDFEHGLPGYEYRWTLSESALRDRGFNQPQWRGEEIAGRTILLHSEQGLGDTFQFMRYVPLVAQRGAHVILRVQTVLRDFLREQLSVEVIGSGDPLPPFDLHCPLLSLPLAFGTRLESIPSSAPYLAAPAAKRAAWKEKFAPVKTMKIGLVCSGNPAHRNDTNRSIPLGEFAPLAGLIGGPLYLVQKDIKPSDASTLVNNPKLIDLSQDIRDFGDTAAILSELDLLITVDTSLAHLAGAMARPVWTLLPCAPDWRWLLDRPDSPWYPTMRLFRQPEPKNWAHVFEVLSAALIEKKPEPAQDAD